MESNGQTTLIRGTDIISTYLKYFLVPNGFIYKFQREPPHRPKPLSLLKILLSCTSLLFLLAIQQILGILLKKADTQKPEYGAILSSVHVLRLYRGVGIFRFVILVGCLIINVVEHGTMTGVIGARKYLVSDEEQAHYASTSYLLFWLNVISNTAAYAVVFLAQTTGPTYSEVSSWLLLLVILSLLFWTRLANAAPIILSCFLGASLGRHVENFSAVYIDTMFDQFMKAIEKDEEEYRRRNENVRLPFFNDFSQEADKIQETIETECRDGAWTARGLLMRGLIFVYNPIKSLVIRLSMRRYPELPEMKMTKLSSTSKIQISERTQAANNHLVRVRLRRTQVMLSDLRDQVNDINRTSSPLLLLYFLYETAFIIFVTTASVQAKVYNRRSVLIVPTLSIIVSIVSTTIYVCVCLDAMNKQLRLLVNKLFDFIIMNHRVQASGEKMRKRRTFAREEVSFLPGSEPGAINETWCQFQYIRKLAGTIQFTMGGVIPVTRRLVISLLGHILSAVFISIEIMSIIDTGNLAETGAHSAGLPRTHNSTRAKSSTVKHFRV